MAATVQLDADLLVELGWEEGTAGAIKVPQGDDTVAWALKKTIFASPTAAIDYICQQSPMAALEAAAVMVNGAARIAANELVKHGWSTKPTPLKTQGKASGSSYPPVLKMAIVPPGSAYTRYQQGGEVNSVLVEGRDFFSERSLLQLLMDVDDGSRTVPFLTPDLAREVFQVKAFVPLMDESRGFWPAKWVCGWHPHAQYMDGFPDVDQMEIKTMPDGDREGINRWLSKRAFFRALLSVVDRRGVGLLPVGDITGKESLGALWLKAFSPRHGWTWCYAADGSPLLVPPGADLEHGTAGLDYFTSMVEVRAFLVGSARGSARAASTAAARPPMSPGGMKLAAAQPAAAPSLPSSSAPPRGPAASSKRGAQHEATVIEEQAPPRAWEPVRHNLTRGEVRISLSDTWDEVWPKLQKLGWGYEKPHQGRASRGGPSALYYFPGADVRGKEAEEGKHYLTTEEDVLEWVRGNYTLLPPRESAPVAEPMEVCKPDGKSKRKGRGGSKAAAEDDEDVGAGNGHDEDDEEEQQQEPRAKALKATGGMKAAAGDRASRAIRRQQPEDETTKMEVVPPEATSSSKSQQRRNYDDNETYDLIGDSGNKGDVWKLVRKHYGWVFKNTPRNMLGGTGSWLYVRRLKEQDEDMKSWRHGIDYFMNEEEVYEYVTARKKAAYAARKPTMAVAQSNHVEDEEDEEEDDDEEEEEEEQKSQHGKRPAKKVKTETEVVAKKERRKSSTGSTSSQQQRRLKESKVTREMEAEELKPKVTSTGRVVRKVEQPFHGAPAPRDTHTRIHLARGCELWQNSANWVWAELSKKLAWRSKMGKISVHGTSDTVFCVPGGDENNPREGRDFFRSAEAISQYARDLVKADKRLPSNWDKDGETEEVEEDEESEGGDQEEDEEDDDNNEDEGDDEEEEEEGEESDRSSCGTEEEKVDEEANEAISTKDSDPLLIRKMIRQHGFRQVLLGKTSYLLPRRVSASSERGLKSLKWGKDYLPANGKDIREWAVSMTMGGRGGEEQEEEEEEAIVSNATVSQTITAEDLQDMQALLRKLRRAHGWKSVPGGTLNSWIHIPPNGRGKVRGAVEGEDYCVNDEQVTTLVWRDIIDEGPESMLSQEGLPIQKTMSKAHKRASFATSAERGDDEDEDDENDEEEEDAMQIDPPVAEGETEEEDNQVMDVELRDPEDEPTDVEDNGGNNDHDDAHLKDRMENKTLDAYPDEVYTKQHLLRQHDGEDGSISNLNSILSVVHGWRVKTPGACKGRAQAATSTYVYVLPHRIPPTGNNKDSTEGRDWVGTWDLLRYWIEKGYGLLPYRGAGPEDITYPTEEEIQSPKVQSLMVQSLTSPLSETRRTTRGTLSSIKSERDSPVNALSEPGSSSRKVARRSQTVSSSGPIDGPRAARCQGSDTKASRTARVGLLDDDEEPSSSQESNQGNEEATSAQLAGGKGRLSCASPANPAGMMGPNCVTPGSAMSSSSRCERTGTSRRNVITPVMPHPELSSEQKIRYTAMVLRRKGYKLEPRGTHYTRYVLVPPPGVDMEAQEYDSQEEALKEARETEGLVTDEELRELYQKDRWRPLITRLREIRSKIGHTRSSTVRDSETRVVTDFLLSKALVPTGGAIYLCGLPGTGKTEVAKAAISQLNAELRRRGIVEVPRSAMVSCSTFKSGPERLFETAYHQLLAGRLSVEEQDRENAIEWFGKTLKHGWCNSVNAAVQRAGEDGIIQEDDRQRCTNVMGNMKILVLDEIDLLLENSAGRKVLSELFSFSLTPNSTLLLIGISNTVTDRIDQGLTLSGEQREKIPPSVVFHPFGEDDLMEILRAEVHGAINETGLKKLAKSVFTKAGDARKAVGYAKDAIDAHLKVVEQRASEEGAEDVEQSELDKLATVPMGIILSVSKDDVDSVSQLKDVPLYQRLLLTVLLDDALDGHEIRKNDLKSHFGKALSTHVAGNCGNDVFETSLQGLVDRSLAREHVHHKGGLRHQQLQELTVTCSIDAEDYLRYVPTEDDTLFRNYVASIRKKFLKVQQQQQA